MTIEENKKKKEKLAIFLKGCLGLGIAVLTLGLFLFLPYIIFTDNSVDVSIEISGFKYLISSFSNSIKGIDEVYGNYIIGYNIFFTICTWIIFLLQVATVVSIVVMYFVKKKENIKISFIPFVNSLLMFLIFIFFIISSSTSLTSIDGSVMPFYKVYEFGVSILICFILNFLCGAICKFITSKNIDRVKRYLPLYFILIVPAILILTFSLYPILLQTVLSFKDYKIDKGIWKSDWVGFQHFHTMFTDSSMLHLMKNTIIISCSRMVLGIIPPLILAIMLYDVGSPRYRKILQTIIYIPHFFSWVIIFAIAYAFVNQEGIINNILVSFGLERITFFNNDEVFYPLIFITDLWKELGWGTIIFLAALSGVDPNLYEAASIDGAGAMDKLFKITIPSIAPTIAFVSIMAVGNILKGAGGEQLLLFGTEQMQSAQTIDTWVIWQGLQGLKYGLSSAVSFFQSGVGLVLVLSCNHFSKKYANMGII